ncbi:hypothetical protein CEXT_242051 [Caerostris extrusa]|uniref:Uncharacterized protein n=1 Tax=Caerostris extrusa TaxID=172846 RepID=A0AAV4WLZ6_CAEEX|nr:hypothetical protein CEXT_242051 [Caerostris extrusa]
MRNLISTPFGTRYGSQDSYFLPTQSHDSSCDPPTSVPGVNDFIDPLHLKHSKRTVLPVFPYETPSQDRNHWIPYKHYRHASSKLQEMIKLTKYFIR